MLRSDSLIDNQNSLLENCISNTHKIKKEFMQRVHCAAHLKVSLNKAQSGKREHNFLALSLVGGGLVIK